MILCNSQIEEIKASKIGKDNKMIREIKNKVYYIKTYSEDDYVVFKGFIESDNLETVKKYIAENFSKSHHFFIIEDLQYNEYYYV